MANSPFSLRREFGTKNGGNSARHTKIGRPERAVKFREEIRRLRAEGVSYQRIGERLGIAAGSVHRLVKLEALHQPSSKKDAA